MPYSTEYLTYLSTIHQSPDTHHRAIFLFTDKDLYIMQKRMQTLSPIGEVITAERKALGIRVVDFCREAHISRVTYYELLKGNTTP